MIFLICIADASATRIYVDPPDIIDQGLNISDKFFVHVKVSDVSDLAGVEFKLYWDPTVLSFVQDSLFIGNIWSEYHPWKREHNDTAGYYYLAYTKKSSSSSFSGSEFIAQLELRVENEGISVLDLREIKLGDSNALLITLEVDDGIFSSYPCNPDGTLPDGLCHEACGANSECDMRSSNSAWCGSSATKKTCDSNCVFSEENCQDYNGKVCTGTNRCGTSEGDTLEYRYYSCYDGDCNYWSDSYYCSCYAYDTDSYESDPYKIKGTCTKSQGCEVDWPEASCKVDNTETDFCWCNAKSHQLLEQMECIKHESRAECEADNKCYWVLREFYVSGSGDSATCDYEDIDCAAEFGSDYGCSNGRCDFIKDLSISPNSVWAGKTVKVKVTGLTGLDGKTVYVGRGDKRVTVCTCTIVGDECSCNFSAPQPLTSPYYTTLYAKIDGEEVASQELTVYCKSSGQSCSSNYTCCAGAFCSSGTCKSSSGGCPVLKAWDGKDFVEIETLNIHSEEGIDIEYTTSFEMKPVDGTYKVLLKEASYLLWEGSHIDSVKLTDSEGRGCKLIKAEHSKLGNVLSLIKQSDDIKAETKPGEEISLIFTGCTGDEFTFTVEGYNPINRIAKLTLSYANILIVIAATIIVVVIVFEIFKFFAKRK